MWSLLKAKFRFDFLESHHCWWCQGWQKGGAAEPVWSLHEYLHFAGGIFTYQTFSTHTQKLHFFSFFLYFIMSFSKKFFSLINIISQIKKTYFNKYIYFSLQNTILRYFFLQEPSHKNRLSVFPITITSRWSCLLFTNRTLLLLPFHHVPFH